MIEETAIIAVIVALVQLVKGVGFPSNYAPLVAIALGLVASIGFGGISSETVFTGVVYGLSAAGLYSGTRALMR